MSFYKKESGLNDNLLNYQCPLNIVNIFDKWFFYTRLNLLKNKKYLNDVQK